uniref:Lipoprotein n=1 Tax=Triticum urartu TaxID=4572 RepID=A0A8R7TY82_TRIUA
MIVMKKKKHPGEISPIGSHLCMLFFFVSC